MEGERRVVTMLFCDVKGSTAVASHLDPEEWAEIINGAFEFMIQPIYQYEGTVARLMGDGLLAFFGAPIAHEDDPQRAILAGLDILQSIKGYGVQIKQRWGIDFDVRVGINTGLVVVGDVGSDLRLEYTALGNAINLAARMEQTAQPGTVQIAEPTYKLVEPLFDFKVLEEVEVKGQEKNVTAYQVLGRKQEPGQLRGIKGLEAPLIGRDKQLNMLSSALDDLQYGTGQLISVIGEAGLGKSRLISEFQRSVAGGQFNSVLWLQGSSLSYQTTTPFAPFTDLLRSYFDLNGAQTDRSQYDLIKADLEDLFPGHSDEMAPFIATMIGLQLPQSDAERVRYLEPPPLRGLIFHQVSVLLERLGSNQPMVIFLDDLHWTDPTSLELLQSLLPLTDRLPLMIITAFRPRRQERSWQFHEICEREYHHRYRVIALKPLDERQSGELVTSLLGIDGLPDDIRRIILDKFEGNPFFLEEIIRSLLDRGQIVKDNGHWRATSKIVDINMPDTLNGLITARLDQLDESSKRALQSAAVLGREFSYEILAEIVDVPELLDEVLTKLQRRELLWEKNRIPPRTYIFKHALTQDATYNSTLLSKRRELHAKAADALIRINSKQSANIARHLLESRQPVRAMPYLVAAGDQAARAYALMEAKEFYNQALEIQGSADDMADVRRAYEGLGGVLTFANQLPKAEAIYQQMLALAETHREVAMQVSALNKLASLYALRMGQFQQADQYLTRADHLAREYEEQAGIAEMALIRCQMCTAQADFDGVITHMDEMVEVGHELGAKEHIAMGLEHVSSSLMFLTRFDEALEKAQEALAVSQEIGDREHEAGVLTGSIPLCLIRDGKFKQARDALEEGVEIGTKIGAIGPQVFGNWQLAELARLVGDYEQALTHAHSALDTALPVEEFMPFMVVPPLGTIGSLYQEISDQFTDKIAEFHHHALRLLETPAGVMSGSTAWADLGFCAMALGDLSLAEESFQKGLHQPTMFYLLERPRIMAGAALLALKRNDLKEAYKLALEARTYAEERQMRHMYPLTSLVESKVQKSSGQLDSALAGFKRSEVEAETLSMRPIILEARHAQAKVLTSMGRDEEANTKLSQAKEMMEEIADLFQDEALRSEYLRNKMAKIQS
jgi:class 3 adenylate cyclase/tetratricopeptide (TPR) repeat protein